MYESTSPDYIWVSTNRSASQKLGYIREELLQLHLEVPQKSLMYLGLNDITDLELYGVEPEGP